MKKLRTSKLAIIVISLFLATTGLLVWTSSSQMVTALSNGISFIDRLIRIPFAWVNDQKNHIDHLLSAYEENKELKATLLKEKRYQNERDSLKKENKELRQLLKLHSTFGDYTEITGKTISRTPALWLNNLTIDVGKKHGVTKRMLAISDKGLIGVVSQVGDDSSVVSLLIEKKNQANIAVKIKTDAGFIYGILTGYNQDKAAFIVSQLNRNEAIPIGSTVTTSGLGNYQAADIEVGSVRSVLTKKDNLTRELLVSSPVDFSDVSVVLLVGGK